jgi:hypothetical protein
MLRIEVSSVEEAVVLANRYKAEGRDDWFRGRVRGELPPRSSLVRIQHDVDALDACRRRLRMFCDWAWEIDYLAPLLEEDKKPGDFGDRAEIEIMSYDSRLAHGSN